MRALPGTTKIFDKTKVTIINVKLCSYVVLSCKIPVDDRRRGVADLFAVELDMRMDLAVNCYWSFPLFKEDVDFSTSFFVCLGERGQMPKQDKCRNKHMPK